MTSDFFVPILNLFRPYQVMKEIWRGSNPEIAPFPDGFVEREYSSGASIVGWWWAFWIVMNLVSQASVRIGLRADDLPEWIAADWISLAGDAISVVAAVLAILVVRGIDANQEERFRRLGADAGTAAPMTAF